MNRKIIPHLKPDVRLDSHLHHEHLNEFHIPLTDNHDTVSEVLDNDNAANGGIN